MGNWTSVQIEGSCAEEEVDALRECITVGSDYSNFHCLSNTEGLGGLGDWAAESISACGNLAERDYGKSSVKDQLEEIAEKVPSLEVKVHVGGDHESKDAIATVTLKDGKATIGDPEKEKIPELSMDAVRGRLMKAMGGGRF